MTITARIHEAKLTTPFRISHSAIESIRHIHLRMHAAGVEAFGEVVHVPFLGGTLEDALTETHRVIETHRAALATVSDVVDVRRLTTQLQDEGCPNAVRHGIEMLAFDHLGKIRRRTVARLLGLADPPATRTPETLALGCPTLPGPREFVKVKLGGDTDARYLEYVSAHPETRFILDVNGGWRLSDAERFAPIIGLPHVVALEEPLAPEHFSDLPRLRSLLPNTPVILDESVRGLEDVERVLDHADGVNIKVAKFGGLLPSLDALTLLRRHGKKAMLGCYIESSLSITYAFALAGSFDIVDLDGATFLSDDPFEGAVVVDGHIGLPKRAGRWGVGCVPRAGAAGQKKASALQRL